MEEEKLKPINSMWIEKYRPKNINGMVLDSITKDKIKKYISEQSSLPHFLFYSKTPGTGKTTLAKAIINELGCDSLILNSSDDRKIETVREKVKEFSLTKSSKKSKKRCVFLDEFDGMLSNSQNALRNIMETYSSNVFFILTCNNINKIIEPLQNRCVPFYFSQPDKNNIFEYLKNICEKENMVFTDDGLKDLIRLNYPSIRNCVSKLQDLNMEGKEVNSNTVKPFTQIFDELYRKLILEKNWKEIKKELLEGNIDPREFNYFIWEKEINKDDTNLRNIQICCRNERDICLGADSKVIVVTSLPELIK